jgi:DNA-binding response OmpR family regulator
MVASKILIVHYDPGSLDRLRKILEANDFEVAVARDGTTAMVAFLEQEPDLVLLEAMLPKVHGFEVCADLKKTRRGRGTPVVVMSTVYKGRKYRDEAIHTHGADAYIEMPLADAELVATLRRSLGKPGTLSKVEKGA